MKSKLQLYVWTAAAAMALTAGASAQSNTGNPNTLGHVERADKVYGKKIISSDNQKAGNLNNLMIDLESGRILYATVSADKGRVAVVPEIFTQTPSAKDSEVRANVTRQKIDGAPQFTSSIDKPEAWGSADFISKVYQYFGQPAWWQGNQPANVGSFNNVHKASEAIGMKVENVNNTTIGKVYDVMVDLPPGRVVYIIMTPDSSLNLGNNLLVLPPQAFTLSADHKNLVSNLDQSKLASAPHFDKNNWPNLSDPSFASQVYQFYGKQAYFNTGNLTPTGR